ncbi:helix-turn-helix domain-containing protein [Paenarthrobacter sp. NPDC089989]|uniref:helix-turn-helix domain-containing protein n=1 Tax=unclassified Paenarthrobacter TaxID=2634190 RepID=UPI00381561EC
MPDSTDRPQGPPEHDGEQAAGLPCTINDLLAHPALQLRPIRVLDTMRASPVESAQIIVEPEDLDGLGRNELVLILGSVPKDTEELESLLVKIKDVGAVAVALPETYRGMLRSELIDGLVTAGLPVLEVPLTTRFADLIDTVNRFQSSPDAVRFNKMVTMQQSLVAALGPREPLPALLTRLAKICGGGAAMVAASGEVLASQGVLPVRLLLEQVAGSAFPETEVNSSGWNALAVRFDETASRSARWLLVGGRRDHFVSSYVRAAARVAASLIDAADRIDVLVANQDQAVRSSVLEQLLNLKPYDSPDVLAGRASSLGIVFSTVVRVLDIVSYGPQTGKSALARPLEERIGRALLKVGATALVCRRSTSTAVLVEADPAVLSQGLSLLLAEDPGLVVGLGRSINHVREASTSHYDAVLALQQARQQPGARIFSYDDFKFTTRLLAHVGLERMAEWSLDTIGALQDKPILLEALDAFFTAELDVMAAAKALHIHHNSLRYRLQKIEDIVGGSLRSPDVIASVHLARLAEQAGTAAGRVVRVPRAKQPGVARAALAAESPLDSGEQAAGSIGAVPSD